MFEANQCASPEAVTSDLNAVKFTITDVGSKWKATKVKYKVKHEGKSTQIKTSIEPKNANKSPLTPLYKGEDF